MWRKPRKTILVAAGLLYVLFGLLAFFDIPGGHGDHHHTLAHNLTHITIGVALLVVTLRSRPTIRQGLCFAFAAAYAVIALTGMLAGKDGTLPIFPGLIEFHAGDYGVHFATGLFFLALGFLKRSDRRGRAPSPA